MTKGTQTLRKIISDFYMVIILVFLYAPIFTMMVLSFNRSKSRTQWGGFTLDWYVEFFQDSAIMSSISVKPSFPMRPFFAPTAALTALPAPDYNR